jgi:hypothetical protein
LQEEELIAFMMTLIVLAGASLMIAAMMNRRKMREMAHRERLAMIDRGLMPAPERDPAAFEAGAGLGPRESAAAIRFRTSGIILIGLGVGMTFLITFTAGEPQVGLGVGGAWAALGAALLFNYFLMTRHDRDTDIGVPRRWTPPPPPQPREPPPNIAP